MKNFNFGLLFLYVLSLSSCLEPVVDPDIVGVPDLVVISNFTNEDRFEVLVKKVYPYSNLHTEAEYVDNAIVTILAEGEKEQLIYVEKDPQNAGSSSCYESVNLKAKFGIKYQIKVEVDGFDVLTSESEIPFPSEISGTQLQRDSGGTNSPSNNKLSFTFEVTDQDLETANFFHMNVRQFYKDPELQEDGSIFYTNKITQPLVIKMFNPGSDVHFFNESRGILFSDSDFGSDSKKQYTLSVELEYTPESNNYGSIVAELQTINQMHHDYLLSSKERADVDHNPIGQPEVDVTNIRGGAGLFSGVSSRTDTIVITQ